jgi:uncharacterized protein (TIGR02145 family)
MKIFIKNIFPLAVIVSFIVLFYAGCKKDEENTPAVHETGTVTDIEGNVYPTIKIGDQWWMAENLGVKKYRDGTSIVDGQDSLNWVQGPGAYCLFENNTASPGLLYNWAAVTNTSNLAPAGWHIPSDEEWKTLERTLGMSSADADNVGWRGVDEGGKLKIASPNGWTLYDDVWSTNESGFTALAGSCRLFNATFGSPGLQSTGFWWSATERLADTGWYRYLDYKSSNIFRSHANKNYGFSVRCVKD